MKIKLMLALLVCLMLSTPAFAQLISGNEGSGSGRGQGQGRGGPPKEAVEACSAKSEGDSCSFSGRKGYNVAGTCTTKQNVLVCFPEGTEDEGRGSRKGRK